MKYEYLIRYYDSNNEAKWLNNLGEEGWRLVQFIHDTGIYYFIRECNEMLDKGV